MTMALIYPIVYVALHAGLHWLAHGISTFGIFACVSPYNVPSKTTHFPMITNLTSLISIYRTLPNSSSNMALKTHASNIMEVDGIIDNNENISTEVCEKTVNICNQLPEEDVQLVTTAYTGLLGHSQPLFHENLCFLMVSAAKMILKAHMLSILQVKSCEEVGLSNSDWITPLPCVFHNDDEITQFLSDSDFI